MSVMTWLYTVIECATVRVPYDLRTGVIYWHKVRPWDEPPSKVNDEAMSDGFHVGKGRKRKHDNQVV